MYQGYSPVLSKWMKPISEVNGRTNEKPSGIRELNEGEEPRSNRYLGSSVAMVRSGLRLLKMLKLILFNHLSQKKYQQALLSVPIPGKLTPGSLHEDTSIVLSITGNDSIVDGKGNHINGMEGFWGYLKRKLASKGGIRREKLPLYLGEYVWR
jgi:hypothetical protein